MMLFTFREPKREALKFTFKEKIVRMDLPGTVLFISSIVCLFLGLEWGGNQIPWSDSKAWGLLLGFGLLFSVFIVLQLRMGEKYGALYISSLAVHTAKISPVRPSRSESSSIGVSFWA
jgi:hypothetical protein